MILSPFLMDLAKVVSAMRADWPLVSIHRALCQCEGREEREIALAAVRIASDPLTKSPTRLAIPGPWWLPVDLSDDKPQKGAHLPPPYRREHIRAVPPPDDYARARAQLRAARPSLPTEPAEEASNAE